MKIQIENLKAQMQGKKLSLHQRADALIEFNKLVEYVKELKEENRKLKQNYKAMDLKDLKKKLENNNEVVYPESDYNKRQYAAAKSTNERSVLPTRSIIKRFIEYLFRKLLIKCDICSEGRVRHDHSEQIGNTWIEVYKCDRCGGQFV